ncbi:hypothetical protein PENTCL1PPCAC_22399, partial [Pristionchus entomophagus]
FLSSQSVVSMVLPLLLLLLFPLFSLLISCFKSASIRTQAKKKYNPGHIPVFEDPEKPENSTQYDMKTERFFPKKGEDNPFEEDCKEKTERTQKENKMQMQPSSGDEKMSSEEKGKKVSPSATPAAASASPAVQPTQPSVPTPAAAR